MTSSVTVLMSCYNAERWLDEAVNSVLTQTHDNFEFIVIDDGSTDDSLQIIPSDCHGGLRSFQIVARRAWYIFYVTPH